MYRVLKFGGTSLKDDSSIEKTINIIKKQLDKKLIVVTSAMGRYDDPYATDTLKTLAKNITYDEQSRLLSCGEIISSVVLSSKLNDNQVKAISLSANQSGLKIRNKKLVDVDVKKIKKYLETYNVVIIPGFQGINRQMEIEILEKGDSDYTAVYLARRLNLDRVYLYSDVCGIYTGDPKYIDDAKLLNHVGYHQAMDLAKHKARIICYKALKEGNKKPGFKIKLSSYLNDQIGTLIDHDDTKIKTMSIDFDFCLVHFEKEIVSKDLNYLYDQYGQNYFVNKNDLDKLVTPYLIIKNYVKVHFVGCGLNHDKIYRNFLDRFAIVSQKETASYYIDEKSWHQDINLLHDVIVRCD
ncbi:MAG: aspartate kinase [Thomasclavelia sp.]